MKPTMILLHIPRTGGTTTWRRLGAHFLHASVLGPSYDEGYKEAVAKLEGKVRVIASHFPYGAHELLRGPYEYATVLRDPVARFGSIYRWHLGGGGNRRYHELAKAGPVELARGAVTVQNGATKILSGLGLGAEVVTEADYRRAVSNLSNLSRIRYVGFTEDLDEWLDFMCRYLGLKDRVGRRGRTHITGGGKHEFTTAELREIHRSNSWDVMLYNQARKGRAR
jgi:hypothetical protein